MKDTTRNTYLAVDFGGGSGRVIAGSLLQGKLELEEIHRLSLIHISEPTRPY